MDLNILEKSKEFFSRFNLSKIDQEIGMLELYMGIDQSGTAFYAYVAVKPSRYAEYKYNIANSIPMNIEEFGEVIFDADGNYPPQSVQTMMAEKHGVDHSMPKHVDNFARALEDAKLRIRGEA